MPPPAAVVNAEQVARETASAAATQARAWWGRLDPQGKKPTLIVAGVLVALVLGTQVVNGIIPVPSQSPGGPSNPGGPTVGARPVDVGLGVRVYVLPGWQQLDAGGALQGVRLQKGSVVLDLRVTQFTGDHVALLTAYVNQILQPDAQQLNVNGVTVVPVNGRTAARATYLGLFNGVTGAVEGELTTLVSAGGVGVIVDAWGAQGSLSTGIDEVHAMVNTIEVP
jgi:hypothetical protein